MKEEMQISNKELISQALTLTTGKSYDFSSHASTEEMLVDLSGILDDQDERRKNIFLSALGKVGNLMSSELPAEAYRLVDLAHQEHNAFIGDSSTSATESHTLSYPVGSLRNFMDEEQWIWWNEGLDHHPKPLEDCPYEVGTSAYSYFEDGWWFADNE